MEDSKIISLLFERDERALEEAKAKYERLCYKISFNLLKKKEDAEECLSDTFLQLWNSVPPNSPKNLSLYLCKITRNNCLNRLKYNSAFKRNKAVTVSFDELSDGISSKEETEETIFSKELGESISRFLWGESERNRKIFVRKYWYGDSSEDIAKLYNMNSKTVRSILSRTRQKLKIHLEKEGYII